VSGRGKERRGEGECRGEEGREKRQGSWQTGVGQAEPLVPRLEVGP